MSEDPWAEWEPEPDEKEERAEWAPQDVEEEEEWRDVPEAEENTWVDEHRPAKYARLSDGAKALASAVRTTEAMPELRDPWAVLDVPQGSPVERGETMGETIVRSEGGEQQPAKKERVQKTGKLTGWSSAEQVVRVGMVRIGVDAR